MYTIVGCAFTTHEFCKLFGPIIIDFSTDLVLNQILTVVMNDEYTTEIVSINNKQKIVYDYRGCHWPDNFLDRMKKFQDYMTFSHNLYILHPRTSKESWIVGYICPLMEQVDVESLDDMFDHIKEAVDIKLQTMFNKEFRSELYLIEIENYDSTVDEFRH